MFKMQSIIQRAVFIVTFSLASISGFGQEDNGDNLTVYTKSSSEAVVYSVEEINKITFSENGVQIWNTNWPTEYAYSNVRVLILNTHDLPIPGDANGDGIVNAADIVEISNYINGKPSKKFNASRADANGDESINQADIETITNFIFAY